MPRITPESRPKLPRGVRLRFDEVRDQWTLLAPERAFQIDATAAAILKLCDGTRDVTAIIAAIAAEYDETPEVVGADITAMLEDLCDKRVIDP